MSESSSGIVLVENVFYGFVSQHQPQLRFISSNPSSRSVHSLRVAIECSNWFTVLGCWGTSVHVPSHGCYPESHTTFPGGTRVSVAVSQYHSAEFVHW